MRKILISFVGVIIGVFISFGVFGQIFSIDGGGTLPDGWTSENNVSTNPIDKGEYYLVDAGNPSDRIITTNYDLSLYSEVTLNVKVASYSSGGYNELKVEFSTDGGSTWSITSYTSATTTGSSYIDGGPISITQTFTSTTKFRFSNNGTSGRGVRIQNLVLSGTPSASSGPTITNISHTPTSPTNSETVSVSADITDADVIGGAEIHWGTTSGSLTNNIDMSISSGDTYETDTDIPVQTEGTTVYYEVYAIDNNIDETTSDEQSYTVTCPSVSAPNATAGTSVASTSFTANWGSVSGASGYEIDVYQSGGLTEILNEPFDDGVSPFPTDWTKNIKVYTYTSGNPGDALKLGSGGNIGAITTPTVDCSGNSGEFILKVDAKEYSSSENKITISHAPDGSTFSDVESTTLSSSWTTYTYIITGGTVNSKIMISTYSSSIERAYIDNVIITEGGGSTYTLQNQNVGNNTSYSVTGLTLGETYKYVVRAYNDCGNESVNSNEIEVTTVNSIPTITVSSLTDFGNVCTSTTAGPNSFTITGTNLSTEDVTIASLTGFSYSTSSDGTYTSSLTLSQTGGSYSQEIFVKFNPTLVQSYDGNIVVDGGGVSTSVNCTTIGSGINTAPSISSPTSASITTTTAVLGGNITSTGCANITKRGIYWSTTNGFADGAGTEISETAAAPYSTGVFTVNVSSLSSSTTYYYKAFVTNSGGTVYTSQGTFVTSCAAIDLPYTENFDGVTQPAIPNCMTVTNNNTDDNTWITCTNSSLENFDDIEPYSGTNQIGIDYNSSAAMDDWFFTPGLNLTNGTTYRLTFWIIGYSDTYTEKLEVKYGTGATSTSMNAGTLYTNNSINYDDFPNYTQIISDFTPTSSGVFYIGFHGYSDADQTYIFIDDIGVDVASPEITVSTAILSGFSYVEGSGPSSEQSFTVEGSNLTNDISLTPPTNYEISTGTGDSFSATNPIALTQTGGIVTTTPIYVRLKSGLSEGSYSTSENISLTSPGADSKTVSCSGDVTSSSAPISLAYQGFEVDPATPADTWNYTGTCTESITKFSSGVQSGRLGGSNSIILENIDITIYDDVALSVAFAAAGPDSGEDLNLEISYDDGTTWTGSGSIKLIDGFSNTPIDFGSTNVENPTTVATNPWIINIDNSETQISVRLVVDDLDISEYYYVDDIKLTGIISGPTITVTPATFTGFTYIYDNGPSAEQSFTISGYNLTEDISIAAPTNFDISETSGSGFASSLTLTQSAGLVTETTIYVRLKSGLAAGDYNSQDITASSTDADNQTVTCSGTVTTPTLSVSETGLTGFEYYYGNGPSSSQSFTVLGTSLTNDLVVSASADYEVSDDEETFGASVSLTPVANEIATTTIYVRLKSGLAISEYNLENLIISSTGATSANIACSGEVVLAPVTDLSIGCTGNTSAEISWTAPVGTYDGVVIAFRDDDSNPPHTISDGTDPATIIASTTFTSGTEFGSTSPKSYVVYKGTETSITVAGLTQGETYKVKAYTYSGTNWIDNSDCPTVTVSNLMVADVSFANNADGDLQSELAWTNPDGSCFDEIMIVCKHSTSVTTTPTGYGTAYNANTIFASGTDIGTNEYVVYKGNGTTVTVTGLTNDEIYYATIFVRSGTDWSAGVELVLHPAEITELEYGDLAIVAVNTGESVDDEISFVSFKSIVTGTDIDFTDNGYERSTAGKWGDTEGTIRISRTGATVPAGAVITIVGDDGGANPVLGTDFNIYVGGANDNANWSLSSLNGSSAFNMNSTDQIWIMQGGTWSNGGESHEATYSGNVLYGWTATGWESASGYNSTKGSTIYPGCECATTNVIGLTNVDKVKYNGSTSEANRIEWIGRINDPDNWDDYTSNALFDAGSPAYRDDGATLSITAGDLTTGKWAGYKSEEWCDCANWWSLRVPDQTTDVLIPDAVTNNPIISSTSEIAQCNSLEIELDANLGFLTNTELEIYGDLIINTSSENVDATNGLVRFASSTTSDIKSNGVKWNDVTINGTGEFSLSDDLIVAGTLSLADGVIETGADSVIVENTALDAIVDYDFSSYVNGNLRRYCSGAGSYDFPVGTETNFELANVNVIEETDLQYLETHFEALAPVDINISGLGLQIGGTPLISLLDAGLWQISPNDGAAVNYDIVVKEKGSSNAGSDPDQHAVVKRDDALSDWELKGTHDNGDQSISDGVVSAKSSNLAAFSQFAIARSQQFPLAIELVSFNVSCVSSGELLEWIIASEKNSDYFGIEYSSDGIDWKVINEVIAFGTTNMQQNYQLLIEDSPRIGYFRLFEMDMDGTKTYYMPIYVNCLSENQNVEFQICPNPAEKQVVLSAFNTASDFYIVSIMDVNGKVVNLLTWENPKSSLILNVENLTSGMYYVKVYNESELYVLKFIKK